MLSAFVSRIISLTLGTLYPAYASYKAVRTKNVKEYVKWMMYWIVFALLTSVETFADVFIGFWLPFYYELKICLFIWLLSPATRGSSLVYRNFVHPTLMRNEEEIDRFIANAKSQGYNACVQLGGKGLRYVSSLVMEGMVRAPVVMSELVQTRQIAVEQERMLEDVTDEANSTNSLDQMNPDVAMSDDDAGGDGGASLPSQNSDSEFALNTGSEEESNSRKGKGRGRKGGPKSKKSSKVNLVVISSGDDSDDPDFTAKTEKKPRGTRKSSRRKQ